MSAPPPASSSALVRRRLAGVAFLVVLALLVWLTILMYQKAFTPVVKVTLKTDRIGNQLSAPADVKLRGIVVGEVRGVRSTGNGATIKLALNPSKARSIPDNVEAQLLPKTLFGEKYVELVLPETPSSRHLRAGDVIPQDRSTTAMETSRALDDILPLLQRLKPAELSLTLNALSTALRDRGNRLGTTLQTTAAYLRRLNPAVPTIGSDLQDLAAFTDNLATASPNLLATLDNLAASSRSVVTQQRALDAFLTSTTAFAQTARSVVAQNETRLVQLSTASRGPLQLFARYAPEYPCFLKALAVYEPTLEKAFGGGQPGLHITVEAVRDRGGYTPGQEPKYRDARAPYCDGLPHPKVPAPEAYFNDGYRTPSQVRGQGVLATNPALALVAAPLLGTTPSRVPDVAGMLLGPVAEGNTVGLA